MDFAGDMIGELSRVVLLVRDFDQSLRFYRDVLELELAEPSRGNWVVLRAGDVLLCLHGPWHDMPFSIDDFGRSPDELLFRVDDLDEARAQLIAKGVMVAQPHEPGPGIRVAEFRDPDGRRIAIESRAR